MLKLYIRIQDAIKNVHSKDEGQDAFEYLLVVGGVSVAVVLAMVTPVGSTMINAVVAAVQTTVIDAVS